MTTLDEVVEVTLEMKRHRARKITLFQENKSVKKSKIASKAMLRVIVIWLNRPASTRKLRLRHLTGLAIIPAINITISITKVD